MWGFRGFTVSDWNGTAYTTTEGCVKAGLSLEMPTTKILTKSKMMKAFNEGKFTIDDINENIRRLLRVMFLVGLYDDEKTIPKGSRNTPEHQKLARTIAEDGIVLLKNERNLLPINTEKVKKIAVIGPNKNFRLGGGSILKGGGGSSVNFPPYEISPLDGLEQKCGNKVEIIDTPSDADLTLIFAGLNHNNGMDAEGQDKEEFSLPLGQAKLIKETIQENPLTIVVLISGSPIGMDDWINQVPCIVEAWYGGMEAGRAIANVLFGDVNPSGKLPLTFPKKLSDSPAHVSKQTYPGNEKVFYEEGIFVGYRHFDIKGIEPLFPFGFGLSYTSFNYENLTIKKANIKGDEIINVSAEITNIGKVKGKEIVQLYIQDVDSSIERPLKELKRFKKIQLDSKEMKEVTFELNKDDLSFYDPNEDKWSVESGKFKILIGSSSIDIRLEGEFEYAI
jgi:beta-glucosidase